MNIHRFVVPCEGERQTTTAREYVARLWPEGTERQVESLFQRGQVEVEGVPLMKPERALDPDTQVTVSIDEDGEEVFGLPDGSALLWGEGWLVVEKPVGTPGRLSEEDPMDPIRFMADMLGVDRDGFTPAWEMPANAGGPWVMGRTAEQAERVAREILDGGVQTTWQALTLRPERGQGRLETTHVAVDYAVIRTKGAVAELQLTPVFKAEGKKEAKGSLYELLLAAMAEAGFAVLGDSVNGGYLVAGGVRLRLGALYGTEEFAHSWPAPREWWPFEPVVVPQEEEASEEGEEDDEAGEEEEERELRGRRARKEGHAVRPRTVAIKDLKVSKKTLEIMSEEGHPWVLRDKETGAVPGAKPGDVVRLFHPSTSVRLFAVLDETSNIAARFWSEEREAAESFYDELEIRLDEAIARRTKHFKELARTDVFRIAHGEADGLPGLWVDRLGPLLRVTTLGRCATGYREAVYEMLAKRDPSAMILEVEHTLDLRRRDQLPQAKVVHRGARFLQPGQDLIVREEGLRYRVEPWEGVDVGFFADQRDNRIEARSRASAGERWLNLFCHTGAFSVALSQMGVHTTNVDLSRRYLNWLDTNFELNGINLGLRENVADDARVYLERDVEPFSGIIVDPPTAASSDAGFWAIKDHYEELLVRCFEVLAKGGSMLVCRNEKRPKEGLERLVRKAAKKAGRSLEEVSAAPPAEDYPRLKGFPEGDKFEGVWVRVSDPAKSA